MTHFVFKNMVIVYLQITLINLKLMEIASLCKKGMYAYQLNCDKDITCIGFKRAIQSLRLPFDALIQKHKKHVHLFVKLHAIFLLTLPTPSKNTIIIMSTPL